MPDEFIRECAAFLQGIGSFFASRWTNLRECTYSAILRIALRQLDQRPLDLWLLTEHSRSHLKVLSVRIVKMKLLLAATLGKPEGAVDRWWISEAGHRLS